VKTPPGALGSSFGGFRISSFEKPAVTSPAVARAVHQLGFAPGPFRLFLNGLILLAVILYLPSGLASLPSRFRRWRAA